MAIDREKTLQTAQALVEKKKYGKALVEYRKVIAQEPSDVRTLLKIGDLHLKLDQFEGAIATYEEVGNHYFCEGFSVKAIAVYKQVRGIIARHCPQLDAKYGHILPRLAEIYTQLGLTSDALAAYDEVATKLRQEGRERDALDVFKKVVELDPENPIAKLRVADSRVRLGDIDKASEAFAEAAEIMRKLGRHDDALKVFERLLEHSPTPEYARLCGITYLERGGPSDGMNALSKLQIAFKADPHDVDTLAVLVQAFDAIAQPRKAIEVLKEATKLARDGGDEERFLAFLEELKTRAPHDRHVQQLVAQTLPEPDAAADVASIAMDEPSFLDPGESIEEVLELSDVEFETLGIEGADPSEPVLLDIPLQSYDVEGGGIDAALHGSAAAQGSGMHPQGAGYPFGAAPNDAVVGYEPSHQPQTPFESLAGGIVARALEEVELLVDLGRFAEARAIVRRNLESLPDNPQLVGAMRQIESMAGPESQMPAEEFIEEPPHSWANLDPSTYGMYSTGAYSAVPDSGSFPGRDSGSFPGRSSQLPSTSSGAFAAQPGSGANASGRYSSLPNEPSANSSGKYAAIPLTAVSEPSARPVPAPDSGPAGAKAPTSGVQPSLGSTQPSPAAAPQPPPPPPPPSAVDPQPVADPRTQYGLGVSYYGVGKYNEAIASLNYASRDPYLECACRLVIGSAYLKLGDLDSALAILHQALTASIRTREQDLAIGYEIANTYELRGMLPQATHFFEWLMQVDASYTDSRGSVIDRLSRLRSA